MLYINTDSNSRGFLNSVEGLHTAKEKFINEVARDVTDPEKKISVSDRARAARILNGRAEARREARERTDLRIGALGSGSDYTAFLDHPHRLAQPLLWRRKAVRAASIHSVYDSFDHYTRFGDPDFAYGIALAQMVGARCCALLMPTCCLRRLRQTLL